MLSRAQVDATTPVSATVGNEMLPYGVIQVNSAKEPRFRTSGREVPFTEPPLRERHPPPPAALVPRALGGGRWDPLCVRQAQWRSHARDAALRTSGAAGGGAGGCRSRAMQRPQRQPRRCFWLILNNCPNTGDCYFLGPVMSGVVPSIHRRPGHSNLPGTGPSSNASVNKASAASSFRYELFDIK